MRFRSVTSNLCTVHPRYWGTSSNQYLMICGNNVAIGVVVWGPTVAAVFLREFRIDCVVL